MDHHLPLAKKGRRRNRLWIISLSGMALILAGLFVVTDMPEATVNLVRAYNDSELYEKAWAKAAVDEEVIEILGELEPVDKLAILEGEVIYHDDNTVDATIRISGNRGRGRLDITARKITGNWVYSRIGVRIKSGRHKGKTIEVDPEVFKK
ncbi:cytochrome c oxidase assembly factor Coa1 family protein [Sinomicrobium oceani]|uniref:cytochrome c oxidase assembly factor Coa1 family protein n=1 Tax=Sinomicrobium oceani TaxID=1150368 RepID=UPI00227A3263|nr:cytochrome c oxidase assembly factor Coa1 family protein [Sinomicrobium oceani]